MAPGRLVESDVAGVTFLLLFPCLVWCYICNRSSCKIQLHMHTFTIGSSQDTITDTAGAATCESGCQYFKKDKPNTPMLQHKEGCWENPSQEQIATLARK